MSKPSRQQFSYAGYRSWFQSFLYNQRINIPIFILDFETHSYWEDTYENQRSKLVNGIEIYFLDENQQKRKAFLKHEPYYYLLLDDNISQEETIRIMARIKEIGEKQVIRVEKGDYFDAANLTFLIKKPFIKVTVDRPGSVPTLRAKSEEVSGIREWREADVLFHHRCAIDHNVRVGAWYQAEITGGEILNLSSIPNKAPPRLKVLAFDIETVFEQTRDPNPNRDAISMISLFNGENNVLLVNSKVVTTDKLQNFDIVLKQSDEEHALPWVDWEYADNSVNPTTVLERFSINVVINRTEKELLQFFYQYIEEYQPDILTDFFGGRFDIPFIAVRSEKYKISLEKETGFKISFKIRQSNRIRKDLHKFYSAANIDHVTGAGIIHLDAYLFNEKYSYLPKKDLGLKPSVEKKLKIKPIGREALFNKDPVETVAYASCDGYITWKYVRELVLDFFISMGQMFPVSASELLTRRAGSLDDLLIDAEDHQHGIIGRRRIGQQEINSFSPSIHIESLAYTGGLVEARKPGIWRSDLYYDYTANKEAMKSLRKIIRKVIAKESTMLSKKVIKEEFDKHVLANFGDVTVEYSEDPVKFLKQFEIELLKNGTPPRKLTKQLDNARSILEEMSAYHPVNVEEVTTEILSQIDQLSSLNGKTQTQLNGIHVDVTSMYPSQIRQYKLQPSGIVPLTMCRMCDLAEADNSCFFEGDWVIKLTAHRPCRFKSEGSRKCPHSVCTAEIEAKCKNYEPIQSNISRSLEIFTFDGKKTEAFVLKGSELENVPINQTYFGSSITKNPFVTLQQWLKNSVDATQLTATLDQNHFAVFDDAPKNLRLPANVFMSLDVRTKKISILLSVNSRVCQKAYNFIVRIMDDFFNTRFRHKFETNRLSQIIAQKKAKNQPIAPELLRQQKYHDSTQLGMKVPLNSVYGLLGMKGGVRNASTPCAGITTKLSADLIFWAANQLELIGFVTELDTDGIWLWVPKLFPLDFPVTIHNYLKENKSKTFNVTLIDKILNEKAATFSRNDNYWMNDGKSITRASKSLIQFEQDGPYDFQFVMGKKKYIVYNHDDQRQTWVEKEITGLESKRADFSKLQKYFQEKVIDAYLEHYNPEDPITLEQLYENANKTATLIRTEINDGRIDPSFFVKPKAINKPLRAYKSKLPQVSAAYILKDLGYSVDPGTRIQMLNIKGNQVIPRQIFDFDFKTIKKVLVKHAIATLSFMLGELSTKEDLQKLIDVRQYSEDVFGPGRIYDRMIRYPMEAQQLTPHTQQELDLNVIESELMPKVSEKALLTPNIQEQQIFSPEKKKLARKRKRKARKAPIKAKKRFESTTAPFHEKIRHQSLENLFQNDVRTFDSISISPVNEIDKKPIRFKEAKSAEEAQIVSNSMKKPQPEEIKKGIPLVSSEELRELEKNEIFSNGSNNNKESYELELDTPAEEQLVCSECGALVQPEEITEEGCTFCGGRVITQ